MKTLFLLFVITFSASLCKAQENNLVGTWNIIECAYSSGRGTERILEQDILSGSIVTKFFLMDEGKFKQTSNTSGAGSLDTYQGSWEVSDNKLIITLYINNRSVKIEWDYDLKENILVLSRRNPTGNLTITNIFRKV